MSEPSQNFANHRRWVPGYHFFTFVLIVTLLVWTVRLVMRSPTYDSWMMLVLVVALLFVALYARTFALSVQNRVIRLEEQLRMARLLSPDLQSRMREFTIPQYVGLRFASDEELPELAARVLNEKIRKADDIKKLVRNWRPDFTRA